MTTTPLYHADLVKPFPLIHQGKVRDSFAIDDEFMLIVASDRLSAFDVVMDDPIPGKGEILTRIANFWFEKTRHIVPNHLSGIPVAEVIEDRELFEVLRHRSVVVKRLKPLPLEAVVRGYLIGSGWKDYQATGSVCGIELPPGLRQGVAQQLDLLTEQLAQAGLVRAPGEVAEHAGEAAPVCLVGRPHVLVECPGTGRAQRLRRRHAGDQEAVVVRAMTVDEAPRNLPVGPRAGA